MRYVYENAAYGPDPSGPYCQRRFHPFDCQIGRIAHNRCRYWCGLTGLSAIYHLDQAGVDVTVLDGQHPMFGATGRNGGFCV